MDWSKAKNILIIAFIITNVFLAYVLINSRDNNTSVVGEEFVRDVQTFLLEKNIKVAVDIPKEIPSLPLFSIKYETYNPQEIANKFLGQKYETETIQGYIYYVNDSESVTVKNGNEIIYENTSKNQIYDSMTTDRAIEIAQKFIEDKGFSSNDYKLSIMTHNNDVYYIEYTKLIDDFYFEKSYMKFTISLSGVNSFERYWIESVELDDSTHITIMSAPRALLKLLSMEEAYGKTINEISVCYYLDPNKHIGANSSSSARGGKATPAWRIVFDDGTKIFLEDN